MRRPVFTQDLYVFLTNASFDIVVPIEPAEVFLSPAPDMANLHMTAEECVRNVAEGQWMCSGMSILFPDQDIHVVFFARRPFDHAQTILNTLVSWLFVVGLVTKNILVCFSTSWLLNT